ncbi:MAG: aminoglycoside phosphotransferase family protein [Actinomycetota bacterium]|nr:aminoglycoside phosphotransferase family protein [Actinomycetota bacterium]
MIEVPAVVRAKALAAGADRWLTDLPDLVATLAADWQLTVGDVFPDATEALVVAVSLPDETPAVLKLLVPRGHAAAHEITVLRLADGDGCARLLRSDALAGALLIERLGPSLHDLALPLAVRLEVLTDAAARVWRPAPDAGLPTGAEKGRWLVEHITRLWDALDHPCSEQAVADALDCAARRIAAHDDTRAVLVHGDVHE